MLRSRNTLAWPMLARTLERTLVRTRTLAPAVLVPAVVALAFAGVVALGGCAGTKTEARKPAAEELSADPLRGPQTPPPAKLDSPEGAVRSYLSYITYAYYVLNSDVASQTLTPDEGVRVDSYVQLNKEKGRAIDQTLEKLEVRDVRAKDGTATVEVTETWKYRYIDVAAKKYESPWYKVAYRTTYTVVRGEDELWRVARVKAQPVGDAPK